MINTMGDDNCQEEGSRKYNKYIKKIEYAKKKMQQSECFQDLLRINVDF